MYKRFLAVQHLIVCPFYRAIFVSWNYLLNLFRPNTPRPTKPDPISKSVAGSGTGEGLVPEDPPAEGAVATGVEVKLVLAGSSDEGQPTIPKNIIQIHKNINNFFILSPP
jgi:hypothetical protein